jgi:hypothetical protein
MENIKYEISKDQKKIHLAKISDNLIENLEFEICYNLTEIDAKTIEYWISEENKKQKHMINISYKKLLERSSK